MGVSGFSLEVRFSEDGWGYCSSKKGSQIRRVLSKQL